MPTHRLGHLGQEPRVLTGPLLFELIEENDLETLSSVISKSQHDGGGESVLKLINDARDDYQAVKGEGAPSKPKGVGKKGPAAAVPTEAVPTPP